MRQLLPDISGISVTFTLLELIKAEAEQHKWLTTREHVNAVQVSAGPCTLFSSYFLFVSLTNAVSQSNVVFSGRGTKSKVLYYKKLKSRIESVIY